MHPPVGPHRPANRYLVPPGEFVELGDVGLWVRQVGKGAPVLCLSGLGYASWCWEELMAALAPDFWMITLDNRGSGRSEKPPGPYSIEMMADDALRVLDHLKAPTAHVVGHSMGGYIALTMALRYPQRVRSLVLANTSKGGPETLPVPPETLEAWREANQLGAREFAERTMHLSYRPGFPEEHPARFRELLERRLEFPTPPMCWWAQNAACERYLERGVEASAIHQPALVMHGNEDRVLPFENGKILAEALPHSRFVPFPGGGHLIFLEEPEKFASLVSAFLSKPE